MPLATCSRGLTGPATWGQGGRKVACSRSLTGPRAGRPPPRDGDLFSRFDRAARVTEIVLRGYTSELTGSQVRTFRGSRHPRAPHEDDASQSACKLGVSCLVNRRHHIHRCDRSCFGSRCELYTDASDVFKCYSPLFKLTRRNPPFLSFSFLRR